MLTLAKTVLHQSAQFGFWEYLLVMSLGRWGKATVLALRMGMRAENSWIDCWLGFIPK